jgi:dienelactone hydrolase
VGDLVTRVPHTQDSTAGGVPATIVRPGGGRSWPAVVLLPGTAARDGRTSRCSASRALPRAGYLVVIPELSGMVDGEVADAFVRDAVNAALDVAHRSDVRRVKVSLVGA